VRMWKPSSVAEAAKNACHVEEHMNLNGGTRSTFLHHLGFVGKRPLGHFLGERAQGHLHMVIESHQGQSP
jgi:hypothetical protein